MQYEESEEAAPTQLSNYSSLYKYNGLSNNQGNRRAELLLRIKQRRNDQLNQLRGIDEIFDNNFKEEEPVNSLEYRKSKRKNYGRKIMLSEWMTEVPLDFESMWLCKICPIGIRNIVVANKGITKVYNRRNKITAVFESNLPGGNYTNKPQSFTLLDCIYRGKEKTYYVLDVLVWNSFSLLQCSTEFRFFFLKSKLLEEPDLISPSNKFSFMNIEDFPALLPTIENQFQSAYVINDRELPVDGALFYHKYCTYMSGSTPLVGWLKPYMIPEKLQLPVHQLYMQNKPKAYIDLDTYLNYIKTKYKKNKWNETEEDVKTEEMEAEEIEECDDIDLNTS